MRIVVVARLLCHILVAVLKLLLMTPRWTDDQRAAQIAGWARRLFGLLDVKLEMRNAPSRDTAGTLFAGNHVSWLDIFALLATADLQFVAKAEVRDWPVAGWLAAQLGTQFLVREKRGEAFSAARTIAGLLNAGANVCIFPEGSTTDGSALRPFRAALFDPARQGRARIQPFAIRYIGADGRPTNAAAFIDDMTILDSLARLWRRPGVRCDIVFLPLIETSGKDRRTLAREVETCVGVALGIPVMHPTPAAIETADGASGDLALA